MLEPCCGQVAAYRGNTMVDTMLHEHGAFERNQDGNLRSRSSLIKCAKDTGHYPMGVLQLGFKRCYERAFYRSGSIRLSISGRLSTCNQLMNLTFEARAKITGAKEPPLRLAMRQRR